MAQDNENFGDYHQYTGSAAADDAVVVQTGDVGEYDSFMLMSTGGSFDVYPSLDGTNYATAPYSLQDFGALDSIPVLSSTAGRVFGFVGKFRKLKVLQAGGTAVANFTMNCWKGK